MPFESVQPRDQRAPLVRSRSSLLRSAIRDRHRRSAARPARSAAAPWLPSAAAVRLEIARPRVSRPRPHGGTRRTAVTSTSPTEVRIFVPTRTRGRSHRRKARSISPARIFARSAGRMSIFGFSPIMAPWCETRRCPSMPSAASLLPRRGRRRAMAGRSLRLPRGVPSPEADGRIHIAQLLLGRAYVMIRYERGKQLSPITAGGRPNR